MVPGCTDLCLLSSLGRRNSRYTTLYPARGDHGTRRGIALSYRAIFLGICSLLSPRPGSKYCCYGSQPARQAAGSSWETAAAAAATDDSLQNLAAPSTAIPSLKTRRTLARRAGRAGLPIGQCSLLCGPHGCLVSGCCRLASMRQSTYGSRLLLHAQDELL